MSILCRIGFHKWYQIRTEDLGTIRHDVAVEIYGGIQPYTSMGVSFADKVCLKCGRRVDEIEKARTQLRNVALLGREMQAKYPKVE